MGGGRRGTEPEDFPQDRAVEILKSFNERKKAKSSQKDQS